MPSWLVCRALAALKALSSGPFLGLTLAFLTLTANPCAADDLSDFNTAVEQFASHNRGAIGYLRTGNAELAAVEVTRMNASWVDVMRRFGSKPPAAFRDSPRYAQTLSEVQKSIADAVALVGAGKADAFDSARTDSLRNSLQSIREQLSTMRKEGRVSVLADCVLEANGAMSDLFAFEDTAPDFSKPDLANKANTLGAIIKRCDDTADAATRDSPEFRRLIDGTLNSLTFIPKVIETHDRDLLTRVIGELRAFDNLLVFRFG